MTVGERVVGSEGAPRAEWSVSGRVVLASGEPAPKGLEVFVMCVDAVPEEPAVVLTGGWGAPLNPVGRRTATDARGNFVAAALPRAKYVVWVEHAGDRAETPVEVHGSVAGLEVKLQPRPK